MAITVAKGAVIEPDDPSAYKIVSLNDHCDSKDHKQSLNDTSWPQSAGILTASQLRDLRGTGENGCSFEFSAPGSSGLIVSVIEMNLRMGVLNESCLDYISVITKFNFGSDKDERCGRITSEQNYHFATTHSLQLKLFSKTPLTNFFDDYILAVVATSYAESQDGVCGPEEFQCTAGDRCIHKGYRCDNVNNCGDNSDEAQLGNSMCLMPLSSLVLIIAGLADLLITWCIVLGCCLRSALTKQKALQQDRWGALAPEDAALEETEEESSDVDDQDDDGGTGDANASTSSQQEKGNAFRNPLAATLRSQEDEREEPAAASEGAS
ncbi:hypothetical protein HPB52_013563 [Rhipicephalus sanguineus]|uniref:CUB domain-containing protein n=1 Tax=Rhipicephalus sanguineus TaxID=34632 RepID=A0A9D4PWD4_RHISA|nr:hypothetical protein HPB52_013563 [Rhipicephalus sanguineus]